MRESWSPEPPATSVPLCSESAARGYRVRGFDNLSFGGESLIGVYGHPRFEFLKGDVQERSDLTAAIQGVQAVIHLAAIVGDPACAKQPSWLGRSTGTLSRALFDLCNATSTVQRFIFASTCSNYGKMAGDGFVDEESPLKPVSLYAELKVEFENHLLESEVREDFVPTALRFATAYGLSPRVRFDLTVNEFAREVALGRELEIFGEQFWRPYCHVDDLARACMLVMQSPAAKVRQNVFGVGDTSENYQKAMLAEELRKLDPEAKISFVSRTEDPRDYRVDFSKIRTELGFADHPNGPAGHQRGIPCRSRRIDHGPRLQGLPEHLRTRWDDSPLGPPHRGQRMELRERVSGHGMGVHRGHLRGAVRGRIQLVYGSRPRRSLRQRHRGPPGGTESGRAASRRGGHRTDRHLHRHRQRRQLLGRRPGVHGLR